MYTVEKVKGASQYIIVDENGNVVPNSAGEKKKVTKKAAAMSGMTLKEYYKEIKNES